MKIFDKKLTVGIMVATYIILSLSSCDNSVNTPAYHKKFFIKYYGKSGNHVGSRLLAVKDGYLLIGTALSNISSDFFVVRTDLAGNQLWAKTYGTKSRDDGKAIAQFSNGNLVIVGNTNNPNGNKDILVITLDPQGNEINRFIIDRSDTSVPSSSEEVHDVIVTSQGNILLAGSTTNTLPQAQVERSSSYFFFPQYTPQLKKVKSWTEKYGNGINSKAQRVFELTSGRFLLVGSSDSQQSNNSGKDKTNIFAFEISKYGVAGDNNAYGSTKDEVTSHAVNTSDGGKIIIGSTKNDQNDSKIFLTRLRSDNSLLDTYIINTQQSITGKAIDEAIGGGFWAVGNAKSPTGTNLYLTKTTNEGAIVVEKFFGNEGNNSACDLIQLDDGSVVILGTINLDNQTKMTLIKVNKNGELKP